MGLAGVIEGRGVELDELHVLHRGLGAVGHGDAVARGDVGVGRGGVDSPAAPRGKDGDLREEGVDLLRVGVEDIGAVAFDVGRAPRHLDAQMVLCDDFDSEMVFQHRDVRVLVDGLDEAALDFEACVVGMVQDAELRVASLAVEVKLAVGFLVEVDAPFQQALDACGSPFDHLLDGRRVADVVARDEGVADVLFKVVHFEIGHRGHAALRFCRVGLVYRCLADKGDFALAGVGYLQGVVHPGHARADYQKVEFAYHALCSRLFLQR